jgi:hypothetical protein
VLKFDKEDCVMREAIKISSQKVNLHNVLSFIVALNVSRYYSGIVQANVKSLKRKTNLLSPPPINIYFSISCQVCWVVLAGPHKNLCHDACLKYVEVCYRGLTDTTFRPHFDTVIFSVVCYIKISSKMFGT